MAENFLGFLKLRPKSSATTYLGGQTPQGPPTAAEPTVAGKVMELWDSQFGQPATTGQKVSNLFSPIREVFDRGAGVVGAGATEIARLPHQLTGLLSAAAGDTAGADASFGNSQRLHDSALQMLRDGIVPGTQATKATAPVARAAGVRFPAATYKDLSFASAKPKKAPVGNQIAKALQGLSMGELATLMGAVPEQAPARSSKDTAGDLLMRLSMQKADAVRSDPNTTPEARLAAMNELFSVLVGMTGGNPLDLMASQGLQEE